MESINKIPAITDPLGKHWDQPSRNDILLDDKYALMSSDTHNALKHYEFSNPSGAYEGKMWRRGDFLCWYDADPKDAEYCIIHCREIIVT